MDLIKSKHMDLSHPYTAICPTLDTEVLSVLSGTSRPMTGREIARLTGRASHSGVLHVLNRLTEHGLVGSQEAGRALLFTLNREHLAAPAVDLLAGMRIELLNRIRQTINTWDVAPVHVSLFGSMARGQGDTQSDVDLFVVRPGAIDEGDLQWRAQLDDLASQIESWTGNHAGIVEAAEGELVRLRKEDPPIAAELRADAIVLRGPGIGALLSPA